MSTDPHTNTTSERHIVIDAVEPTLGGGTYPVKRVVGETHTLRARIFRDGPESIRAVLRWRLGASGPATERAMVPTNPGLDLWEGTVVLEANARYQLSIEAWTDHFASWVEELRRKVEGGRTDLASELLEGAALVEAVLARAEGSARQELETLATRLRSPTTAAGTAYSLVSAPAVVELMTRLQPRADGVESRWYEIIVDRPRARFGAWYELFVRSQGTDPSQSGTFRDAQARLADLRNLGFDVIYLAPIHPIGVTGRKGRNNTLTPEPGDPGSPWAIGNEHGGHDAIEPSLGTVADFKRFVGAARELGMEVALDFAAQCSPDHPWVRHHPEWFYRRPDGTLKYAENPPKKYEDIHPLNFDAPARAALHQELRRVFQVWIDRGVKIFRVDNPHTKPVRFWRWLIEDIHARHPDVLFLAEAFTRPAMMSELARIGFTQSYTYFTWRNTKAELTDYLTELTQTGLADYFRPNFFANTPDILHEFLQIGGRPAFKIRLILAATLSPTYGIYSGFELCEREPVRPGSEEYLNSEKYEIRVRDWQAPGNIRDTIRRVNAIRLENPALQELSNLRFFPADSDQILFYGKATRDRSNVILVAVNLDPFTWHECMVRVPLHELGLPPGSRYHVRDLLTGARYEWGEENYVRLDPSAEPAHIFRVEG